MSSSATRHYGGRVSRMTSDNFTCCRTVTERGDHDFCLSRSYYTDTYPTSRKWVPRSEDRIHDLLTMSHALYPLYPCAPTRPDNLNDGKAFNAMIFHPVVGENKAVTQNTVDRLIQSLVILPSTSNNTYCGSKRLALWK